VAWVASSTVVRSGNCLWARITTAAVAERSVRYLSLGEAMVGLCQGDECGSVHAAICRPEQTVYAICTGCFCCCHDLRYLQLDGRSDPLARSGYVA
jgi:hypothetical protein